MMAPAGTPVVAVEDGTVARLFTSKAGGLTIYQFDPSQSVAYYYAHLQGYASGVVDGATVRRGQVIGYVGSTGNASPTRHTCTSRSSCSARRSAGGRGPRSIPIPYSGRDRSRNAAMPQCRNVESPNAAMSRARMLNGRDL